MTAHGETRLMGRHGKTFTFSHRSSVPQQQLRPTYLAGCWRCCWQRPTDLRSRTPLKSPPPLPCWTSAALHLLLRIKLKARSYYILLIHKAGQSSICKPGLKNVTSSAASHTSRQKEHLCTGCSSSSTL